MTTTMDGASSTTTTTTAGTTVVGPRFSTVLAARGNDGRPSDLEFLLRSHCHKLRVVERLVGQAHLLIPKVADTTSSLAIRLYDEEDLSSTSTATMMINKKNTMDSFFQSFQMAVVFFILPKAEQRQQQLDDPNSLFHSAQQLTMEIRPSSGGGGSSSTDHKEKHQQPHAQDKMARVCMVSSAELALNTVFSIVEAISKRALAFQYFAMQARKHYCLSVGEDDYDGNVSPHSTTTARRTTVVGRSISEACRPEAAEHIADALRNWADRFDMPPGEINVLMSTLGSLGAIATAASQDGHHHHHHQQQQQQQLLESIPIEDRTKRLLRAFFGGSTCNDANSSTTCAQERPPLHLPPRMVAELSPPYQQMPMPSLGIAPGGGGPPHFPPPTVAKQQHVMSAAMYPAAVSNAPHHQAETWDPNETRPALHGGAPAWNNIASRFPQGRDQSMTMNHVSHPRFLGHDASRPPPPQPHQPSSYFAPPLHHQPMVQRPNHGHPGIIFPNRRPPQQKQQQHARLNNPYL